jgi:hypothetical protein
MKSTYTHRHECCTVRPCEHVILFMIISRKHVTFERSSFFLSSLASNVYVHPSDGNLWAKSVSDKNEPSQANNDKNEDKKAVKQQQLKYREFSVKTTNFELKPSIQGEKGLASLVNF